VSAEVAHVHFLAAAVCASVAAVVVGVVYADGTVVVEVEVGELRERLRLTRGIHSPCAGLARKVRRRRRRDVAVTSCKIEKANFGNQFLITLYYRLKG
jgi:hypothetical protein